MCDLHSKIPLCRRQALSLPAGAKNASRLKLDPLFATRPRRQRASLSHYLCLYLRFKLGLCGRGKELNFTSKCDKRHFNPDWILYKGTSKCAVSCMLGGRSLPVLVRACSRSGCALFSSNWYCLAHGGHAAPQGGGVEGPTLQPPPLLALQYLHRQARSVGQAAAPTAGPNRR